MENFQSYHLSLFWLSHCFKFLNLKVVAKRKIVLEINTDFLKVELEATKEAYEQEINSVSNFFEKEIMRLKSELEKEKWKR